MQKLVLEYLGVDYWCRPVYKDQNGRILKDVNCDEEPIELCTVCGDFDGEPNTPIKGVEIVITGRENEPTKKEKFNYMMLSRLKTDCDYYLGNGNRYVGNLYYQNEQKHINKMKEIYNNFPDDKRPEWLTWEQILDYEKLITR